MLENKWALVIEDDAHTLIATTSILRDLGIHFKRNTTGANVPEQLRAMNPLPDFILLDIDLLVADAYAVNQRIHSDSILHSIPVIALGAMQDFSLRQRLQRAGFAAFVLKPLPRRQFGDLLQGILSGDAGSEAVI